MVLGLQLGFRIRGMWVTCAIAAPHLGILGVGGCAENMLLSWHASLHSSR